MCFNSTPSNTGCFDQLISANENGFVRQTQLPIVKEFKYFKIHVSVLLSFYVVMIAKGGFFELDKIAIGGNASQWMPIAEMSYIKNMTSFFILTVFRFGDTI